MESVMIGYWMSLFEDARERKEAKSRLETAFGTYKKWLMQGDPLTYALVEGFAVEYGIKGAFRSLAKKHDIPRPARQEIDVALARALTG